MRDISFESIFLWCVSENYVAKSGKTFERESAVGGHLFTICVRFADGCMNLQDVKGVGLFCGA